MTCAVATTPRCSPPATRRATATSSSRSSSTRGCGRAAARPAGRGSRPRCEATDEAFDGALTLLHGDPRRVVPELAARVGAILRARLARDDAGRSPPRRGRRSAVGRERRRVGRDRHPVCRGAGSRRQRLGRPVQGVHPVLEGVAGARLARPRTDAARAAAAARPQRRRRDRRGEGGAGGARPARAAPGGRGGGPAAVARLPRRRAHGIHRRPQPTRPRRHVPALALPQARCPAPAHAARRPRGGAWDGRAHLRDRAGLARVLRRRAVAPAAHRVAGPAARDVADALRRARGRDRGVARRHAPATRSSTPACASCSPRAGCTTGCG